MIQKDKYSEELSQIGKGNEGGDSGLHTKAIKLSIIVLYMVIHSNMYTYTPSSDII